MKRERSQQQNHKKIQTLIERNKNEPSDYFDAAELKDKIKIQKNKQRKLAIYYAEEQETLKKIKELDDQLDIKQNKAAQKI